MNLAEQMRKLTAKSILVLPDEISAYNKIVSDITTEAKFGRDRLGVTNISDNVRTRLRLDGFTIKYMPSKPNGFTYAVYWEVK